jgi:hypothetical protein
MRRRLCIAWLALAAGACAPSPPPLGRAQSAVIAGNADTHDNGILVWEAHVPGDDYEELCTAEVISPHVVLTAAHCTKDPGSPVEYHVSSDAQLSVSSQRVRLDEVHRPDAFVNSLSAIMANGYDVAVGISRVGFGGVTPLSYNRVPLVRAYNKRQARIVGYGLSDTSDDASAGTRRDGVAQLSIVDEKFVGLKGRKQTVCQGDSGGPALLTIAGRESIVALSSYAAATCDPARGATSTNVAYYADFIDGWVDQLDPPGQAAFAAPGAAARSVPPAMAAATSTVTPSACPTARCARAAAVPSAAQARPAARRGRGCSSPARRSRAGDARAAGRPSEVEEGAGGGEPEVQELDAHAVDHRAHAAQEGDGVVGGDLVQLELARHRLHVAARAVPRRRRLRGAEHQVHAGVAPGGVLADVGEVVLAALAVIERDVAVAGAAMRQQPFEERVDGRDARAGGEEQHVAAARLVDREALAERSRDLDAGTGRGGGDEGVGVRAAALDEEVAGAVGARGVAERVIGVLVVVEAELDDLAGAQVARRARAQLQAQPAQRVGLVPRLGDGDAVERRRLGLGQGHGSSTCHCPWLRTQASCSRSWCGPRTSTAA